MVSASRKLTGFTLIEVLLSIVLMSLLMLSAVFAYDYMMQNWKRNQRSFEQAKNHFINWELVSQAIANTFPKMVYPSKPSNFNPSAAQSPGFYFLGRDNGFTAVTAQSVQQPQVAAVYRLFREPDPQDQGNWQLVYEEALLTDLILNNAEQQLPFNFRRVLINNVRQLQFQYKGWPSLQARMSAENELFQLHYQGDWQPQYDGLQSRQHPLQLQIQADELIWQHNFADTAVYVLQQLDYEQ